MYYYKHLAINILSLDNLFSLKYIYTLKITL